MQRYRTFTEVEISDFSVAIKEPQQFLVNAYKVTWNATDHKPSDDELVTMAINGQLNPAPLDALRISFTCRGISRVCLAHLTRHRWVINSESHMVGRDVEFTHVIPSLMRNDTRVLDLIDNAEKLYETLRAEGKLPRDARYILPQTAAVDVFCDCSLRDFKTACLLRLENGLADEINYLFRLVRRELIKLGGFYAEYAKTIDCLGALSKRALNVDDELGNTLNRYGDRERVRHNYDGLNTSWWQDLKTLPDDLLLPDEKEMIERLKQVEKNKNCDAPLFAKSQKQTSINTLVIAPAYNDEQRQTLNKFVNLASFQERYGAFKAVEINQDTNMSELLVAMKKCKNVIAICDAPDSIVAAVVGAVYAANKHITIFCTNKRPFNLMLAASATVYYSSFESFEACKPDDINSTEVY